MEDRKRSEILSTPLLISKVAKELDISEASVKAHLKFFTHWIDHLSNKEDVAQIQIPHVGHLYPNVRRAYGISNKISDLEDRGFTLSPYQASVRESLILKNELIQSKYKEMDNFSFHGGKLRFSNHYFRKGLSTAELQKYQNERNSK